MAGTGIGKEGAVRIERGGAVEHVVQDLFERGWWALALRGLLGVVVGIIALSWPQATFGVLLVLLGAYFFLDGVLALSATFHAAREDRTWWPYLLQGLLGIAVGLLAFTRPLSVAFAVIILVALRCLVTGFTEIGTAIWFHRETSKNEWLLWLAGLTSIAFGILILFRPAAGALALVWLIGAYAILFGIFELAAAFRLRGFVRRHQELVGHAP